MMEPVRGADAGGGCSQDEPHFCFARPPPLAPLSCPAHRHACRRGFASQSGVFHSPPLPHSRPRGSWKHGCSARLPLRSGSIELRLSSTRTATQGPKNKNQNQENVYGGSRGRGVKKKKETPPFFSQDASVGLASPRDRTPR